MRTAVLLLLRPFLWFGLGLSVANRAALPERGPAIIAANHNSHLDTLALLAALPAGGLARVRPVAAADYFLKTPLRRFFALRLVRILPLERTVRRGTDPRSDPLKAAQAALADGAILIVFPEGTRGAPEEMAPLKSGLTKLAAGAVPIVPVYIQGAGRILPKGVRLPVPFTTTMVVGAPLAAAADGAGAIDRAGTMASLAEAFAALKSAAPPLYWH